MAVVLRPPFWVPKPPDDQPWQLKMEWMNSGVLQQLARVQFPLFTPFLWRPYYTQNDPSTWQMSPEWMNSNILQNLGRVTFPLLTPFLWRTQYTQNDPSAWQIKSEYMSVPQVLQPATSVPFKPKRWRLNYDDSSAWQMPSEWMNSGALQQLALVPTPLFTPVPWEQYYGQNDYSVVWVGSPVGRLDTLYRVAVNPFVPQFPDLFAENASWQGEPQSASVALLTAPAPAVQEPQMSPFWAPRPPDDNIRNASQVASPINLLTAQPKPTVPIRWNVTLNDPPTWSGEPINSATLQLLTAPGKAPTRTFRFGLDDPAYWQGIPVARNAPLYLATPFTNRKTYWYSEDAMWTGAPIDAAAIAMLTAAGQAKPFRWNYSLDDAAAWSGAPDGVPLTLTAVTNPFVSRVRVWYAEDAVWSGEPINSAALQILSSAGQVKPFRWNHTLDDPSLWIGSPLRSVTMSMLTVGGQVPPFRWNYTQNDPPMWQGSPTSRSYSLFASLAPSPFIRPIPVWYSEDAGWQGTPTRSAIIPILTAGGKPPTPRYQFNYDDTSLWQGVPINISPYRLASFAPTVARPTQFYSEDAGWLGVPTRSQIIRLLTAAGKPPTPHYQLHYDDASVWTGASINISPYRLASFTPAIPRQPQFNDDAAVWQWSPLYPMGLIPAVVAVVTPPFWAPSSTDDGTWRPPAQYNINLLGGPPPKPFTARPPQWYAENAFWQGVPTSSATIRIPVTPGAISFYVNTPLDDPTWQQPKGFNQVLNTVFAKPFTARPPQFYSEDSLWTWQARRSPIISALTVGGKVKPFRANFTYDDSASWEPTIPTNLILLTTRFPKPFNLSSLWFNAAMFYNIDAPGWVGNPIAAFRSGVPTPPPPRTQIYEWIIRARRRGRR